MNVVTLRSLAELEAEAARWDDLWRRSSATHPTAQAALVANWIRHWAPGASLRLLTIEDQGQLVAALPLVGTTIKGALRVGQLPGNMWGWSGDLLWDPQSGRQPLAALAHALRRLPWSLAWLDSVPLANRAWSELLAALESQQQNFVHDERFVIGQIELNQSWSDYEASWSGNHRRHMRKAQRRADNEGGVALRVYDQLAPSEVEPLLREGFSVEDRSWKGASGSSVMRTPGVWEYLRDEATLLAERGQLSLAFVEHANRAIAFEYGWRAKGVYFTPKVGYDAEFSSLTPSQLLRYQLLPRLLDDPAIERVDFLGPLADATSKWITGVYSVERILVSTGGPIGAATLWGYRHVLPQVRAWRARRAAKPAVISTDETPPEPSPKAAPLPQLAPVAETACATSSLT